jgi:hypothetical protein
MVRSEVTRDAVETYGGTKVQFNAYVTSALELGEWSA